MERVDPVENDGLFSREKNSMIYFFALNLIISECHKDYIWRQLCILENDVMCCSDYIYIYIYIYLCVCVCVCVYYQKDCLYGEIVNIRPLIIIICM